jgi:hypothetical protein
VTSRRSITGAPGSVPMAAATSGEAAAIPALTMRA